MKKVSLRHLIVIGIAAVFLMSCLLPVSAIAAKKRALWSCYDVGASGYIQASSIADALLKKYGIRVRLTPSGSAIGRIMPVVNKRVEMGYLANEVYAAVEGMYEFSSIEWGPQDLRVVLAHPTSIGLVTTKASGIKTLKDAIGKRWSTRPTASSVVKHRGYLAYLGITKKDIKEVEFPSYRAASLSLKEGKTDVTSFSFTSSYAYELESHPKGLHYLEFDPKDKEAIARMHKFAPFLAIAYETTGAGLSKDKGVWVPYYRYPMITVRTDTSDEYVYDLIKKIDTVYPLFKDAYPPNDLWKIERAGVPPADAPFHPAAIKYLKEKGVWKPEHDKWNENRIAHMAKVQKLWTECLDKIDAMPADVRKKTVRGKKFAKYWLDFRAKGMGE
ncbi:TAXI family TRAP transporter solute-binding subunit [Thermodesulfobacteriota bacterium]